MLKNLSIRRKLALMLVGPLVALVVVAVLSILGDLDRASTASDAERQADMSRLNGLLFEALREEAALNQAVASGSNVDLTDVRNTTDAVAAQWLGRASEFADIDTDELIGQISGLDVSRASRAGESADAAFDRNRTILRDIASFDARLAATADGDTGGALTLANQLMDASVAAADVELLGVWAAQSGTIPSAVDTPFAISQTILDSYTDFGPSVPQVDTAPAEYIALAQEFSGTVVGEPVSVDVDAWLAAADARAQSIATARADIVNQAGVDASSAASSARGSLRNIGVLSLLGIVAGAVVAFLAGNRLKSGLDSLNNEAAAVAKHDLPDLAEALRSGEQVERRDERPMFEVSGTDEMAELHRSLNEIRSSADAVGKQQSELLQSGIADMFVNLARRNQTLVDRQLEVIDELEAAERDPDRLGQLYRVDHLATRMRRNAESLLVLAGHTSSRRRGAAVELREVVRVAIGEVEDYRRIIPIALDEIAVAGHVAQDLAHLLSELMENATHSSPPGTVADVIGVSDPDGSYTLQVIDRGTGIDIERLDELNEVLRTPPTNSLTMSRTMGLTVVGRLAERIGVEVTLAPGADGGTVASVDIPAATVLEWGGGQVDDVTMQAIQTIPGQFSHPDPALAEVEGVVDPGAGAPDVAGIEFPMAEPVPMVEPAPTVIETPVPESPPDMDAPLTPTVEDDAPVFGGAEVDAPVFGGAEVDAPVFGGHEVDAPVFDPTPPEAPLPTAAVAEPETPPAFTLPDPPAPAPESPFAEAPAATDTPPFADAPAVADTPPFADAPPVADTSPFDDVEDAPPVFDPAAAPAMPSAADVFGEADVPSLADVEAEPVQPPVEVQAPEPDSLAGSLATAITPPPITPPAPPAPRVPEAPVTPAAVETLEPQPAEAAPTPESRPATTPSGLLKRTRKSPDDAEPFADRTRPAAPSKRSPDQVKNMLSRYKSGLERGRSDGES